MSPSASLPLNVVGVGSQRASMPSPGASPGSPLRGAPAGISGLPRLGVKGQVSVVLLNPTPASGCDRDGSAGADGPWSASRALSELRENNFVPGPGLERCTAPDGPWAAQPSLTKPSPSSSVELRQSAGSSGPAEAPTPSVSQPSLTKPSPSSSTLSEHRYSLLLALLACVKPLDWPQLSVMIPGVDGLSGLAFSRTKRVGRPAVAGAPGKSPAL